MTDEEILAEDTRDWEEGRLLCADCSPWDVVEEQAYYAWREDMESAGYFPEEND